MGTGISVRERKTSIRHLLSRGSCSWKRFTPGQIWTAPTKAIGVALTIAIGQASKASDRLCDCHLEAEVSGNNGCLWQAESSLPLLDVAICCLPLRH